MKVSKKFSICGELFSVEYNNDIDGVPESIMLIPFISNVIPLIWINDAELIVNQIDYTFFKSLKNIKKAYKKMLPNVSFKGKIKYNKLIKNKEKETGRGRATFFSGGVDSYSTLITRINERPDLITLWGADVDFDNKEGWKNVEDFVTNIGKKYNLKNVIIRASVRKFIDNSEIERQFRKIINDDWWHGMQHGIGIIGNVAPYAYKNGIEIIYMPSTHTKNEKNIVCASKPEIDNNFRFANSRIIHEGYEKNRQDKIENICNFVKERKEQINLRVCYRSKNGDNCNRCEKCYRTMVGLAVEGLNPNEFGFEFNENKIEEIEKNLMKDDFLKESQRVLWRQMQEKFYNRNDNSTKVLNKVFNIKF